MPGQWTGLHQRARVPARYVNESDLLISQIAIPAKVRRAPVLDSVAGFDWLKGISKNAFPGIFLVGKTKTSFLLSLIFNHLA